MMDDDGVLASLRQKQRGRRSRVLAILGTAFVSIFALGSILRIHLADVAWRTYLDTEIVEHGAPIPLDQKAVWHERREEVKKAFVHAWTNYEKYAWGADELKPLTRGSINK
jgi:hypothetical protein